MFSWNRLHFAWHLIIFCRYFKMQWLSTHVILASASCTNSLLLKRRRSYGFILPAFFDCAISTSFWAADLLQSPLMDRHASFSLLFDVIIFKFFDKLSLASIPTESRLNRVCICLFIRIYSVSKATASQSSISSLRDKHRDRMFAGAHLNLKWLRMFKRTPLTDANAEMHLDMHLRETLLWWLMHDLM